MVVVGLTLAVNRATARASPGAQRRTEEPSTGDDCEAVLVPVEVVIRPVRPARWTYISAERGIL